MSIYYFDITHSQRDGNEQSMFHTYWSIREMSPPIHMLIVINYAIQNGKEGIYCTFY
jgi:hypothetical protein